MHYRPTAPSILGWSGLLMLEILSPDRTLGQCTALVKAFASILIADSRTGASARPPGGRPPAHAPRRALEWSGRSSGDGPSPGRSSRSIRARRPSAPRFFVAPPFTDHA